MSRSDCGKLFHALEPATKMTYFTVFRVPSSQSARSRSLSPTLQQTRTGSVPPPTTTGNKSSYPVRRHFASRFRNTHWLAHVHRYTGPCFKTDRRGDRPISNLTRVDTNWLTTPNICGLRELATVPAGQIDEQFAGVDADHATRSSSGRRWAICIRSWNTAKA